jgi:hypothetical protein
MPIPSPLPKGTYEPTDERRDRFLKSLSTQTAARDTVNRRTRSRPTKADGEGRHAWNLLWFGTKIKRCLSLEPESVDDGLANVCGHGTVLHVAEELAMDSIGVDIDPACCKTCKVAESFAAN